MQPRRLGLKFFSREPVAREQLAPFIGLFHGFIQRKALPGLLIDVADYAHVPDGPGIVLIGHEVDYGIDLVGGESGLLTLCKLEGERPLADLFGDALSRAATAALAIEAADTVSVGFDPSRLEVSIQDRLAVPNTAAAAALAGKELEPLVRKRLGSEAKIVWVSGDDPRRALTLQISGGTADLAGLAESR